MRAILTWMVFTLTRRGAIALGAAASLLAAAAGSVAAEAAEPAGAPSQAVQTSQADTEGIRAVLQRSQQMQLEALNSQRVDDSDARAQLLQSTFERVVNAVNVPADVRMIVVEGPLLAVCLMGRVVAVNASVADLPEAERTFIVAHEVGHIAYNHWTQLGDLYQEHIPGPVVQAHTDAIADTLSLDASAQAYRHEFEADAFALRLLRRLGEPDDAPISLFQQHLPFVRTTATHPGTQQRLAHLQDIR